MTAPDLASVWAKLGRSEAHVEFLKHEVTAWLSSNPYRLSKQTSPDLTRHGYVISVLNPPNLELWSLIASDAIHNLRCALDHLVYAVAVFQSKTTPPPEAETLAFPICDSPKWFKGASKRIRTLSRCVRTEIEGLQPYNRPHSRLPPLLSLLRDFNDGDKHRLLHLAMTKAWNASFRNVDHSVVRPGEEIEFFYRTAEVVDGAEIAAIIYPRPSPDLQHKLVTDIVISVDHRLSPLGRTTSELADVLLELIPEVRAVIDRVASKA